MLSHKYRFHGHKSLRFVFRYGLVVRGRHVLVRVHKHPHRVHGRVAIVVSKKVAKRAVERNRIRRRLYETIRGAWNDIDQPYDIVVVVASPEVGVMPVGELRSEIVSLLRDAHLLHVKQAAADGGRTPAVH